MGINKCRMVDLHCAEGKKTHAPRLLKRVLMLKHYVDGLSPARTAKAARSSTLFFHAANDQLK